MWFSAQEFRVQICYSERVFIPVPSKGLPLRLIVARQPLLLESYKFLLEQWWQLAFKGLCGWLKLPLIDIAGK
ncbi:hypothetical protein ccrud_13025 [Corynebacterium crudilactis]|uniref:Uncharacterized protein n=1 Tax=Corynebacterium crudilactis TaxID=1652495 RepID=A0A172QWD9_9CORY|nr:hypothetical protein ccrud_13025 [Corynebacterium crudilactis]